jgi:DNA polymerase phi
MNKTGSQSRDDSAHAFARASAAKTNSVPATVLQRFWDLASSHASARSSAAAQLTEELRKIQHELAREDSIVNDRDSTKSNGDHATGDGDNERPCAVVEYAMKRLTRGLGSGRAGARQGFAIALTAVLIELDEVTIEDGFRWLREGLEPITKSTKGNEARDILIGQLFGHAALARALIQKDVSVEAKMKKKQNDKRRKRWTDPEEERKRVVDFASKILGEICRISSSKAYLGESCAAVAIELALSLGEDMAKEALEKCPQAQAWISKDVNDEDNTTADTVWLAYSLYECLPARCKEAQSVVPKFDPKKMTKDQAFFDIENLKRISSALAECPHSHPRVHPIWEILCEKSKEEEEQKVTNNKKDGEKSVTNNNKATTRLEALWETCCEDGLFKSPSHQRKYLGFRVFSILLRVATPSETARMFSSPNFVKCLISNCAKPDNYLHACSTDCLKAISRCAKHAETSTKKRVAIVAALRQVGVHRFDKQLAKSSGISTLMAGLTREEAKSYCEELRESILKKTIDNNNNNNGIIEGADDASTSKDFKRLWALEQTCSITSALSPEDRAEILRFCVFHAFYSSSKKQLPKGVIGGNIEDCPDALRRAFSTRLLSMILTNIRSHGRTQQKHNNHQTKKSNNKEEVSVIADDEKFDALTEACNAILKFDADASTTDVIPNSTRAKEARKNLASALKICEKKNEGVAAPIIPLIKTLIVLHASDPKQFTSIVEDIPRCVDELLQPAKKKTKTTKKSKKGGADNDDDGDEEGNEDLEPMDVLNDLLIAFLAQPSALLRDVTERTFKGVSGKITERGIDDILTVVETFAKSRRENEDGEDNSEDDDDVLEEDDDDSDDDADSSSSEDESEDDDEDSEDDADGMDTEENEGAIAAIRKAAMKMHRKKKNNSDNDSGDDSSGSDDDDFTDDQMFATDKLLAEAFKAKRQELSRRKALKVAAADFKFRALSLLELFAKSQPNSKILPEQIVPRLLVASRNARVRFKSNPAEKSYLELAQRIDSVLTKYACKHAATVGASAESKVDSTKVSEILKSLIELADNGAGAGRDSDAAKGFAKTAAVACSYLAKILESNGKCDVASKIYADAIENKFEKKTSRLRAPFFAEVIKLSPNVLASCVSELATLCDLGESARAQFLRQESLQLLFQIFSSKQRNQSIPTAETITILCEKSLANAIKADVENQSRRAEIAKLCANVVEVVGRSSSFSKKAKDAILKAVDVQEKRSPKASEKTLKALERITKCINNFGNNNVNIGGDNGAADPKKRKNGSQNDDSSAKKKKKKN